MKKEDKIKLVNKFLRFSFYILLFMFIALYVSQATGYYEYELHKKVTFTEEEIKRFEEDVASGKNIDLEEYLKDTNKDFANKTSKLGVQISDFIGKNVQNGIEGFFKIVGGLIDE